MKKIILLSGFLILFSFKVPPHEFYLSVTEISYKEEKRSLQIITRIFTDDLEEALKKRYDKAIRLSSQKEQGPVRESLEKYLDQKLQLNTSRKLELQYLGKEYDSDQVVLYIEIPHVEPFEKISVTNALLTDLFEDQKNIVHVSVSGTTRSLLLQKGRERDQLVFRD